MGKLLDLTVHKYESKDGRHWSTPEQAEYMDGKITYLSMMERAWKRDKNSTPQRPLGTHNVTTI